MVFNPYDSSEIPFECNTSYDTGIELAKYGAQALYIFPGAIFNFYVCWIILIRHRKHYLSNAFYVIYAINCFLCGFMLITTGLFQRPMLYIIPLCDFMRPYLYGPNVFSWFFYTFGCYGRAGFCVNQIFLVVNRFTCLYVPFGHERIWRKALPIIVALAIILPFGVVWNLLISRVYWTSAFGGASMNYKRRFSWASLSLFQTIYVITSLIITLICTVATIIQMIHLPMRLKNSERSLCITTILTSIGFCSAAAFQFYYAFIRTEKSSIIFAIQFFSYDYLAVSNPVILVINCSSLRNQINTSKIVEISPVSHATTH
ncbi:unnamed protein product [Caenorhabditis bovis]|uniref:Serpentine receptor class gamma n=1 Tax=Caenorhabditis bovis TaxID=2654633 RepID=A0A8S1EJQ8_9PELO|nr:unnamed protein product [Caenorhabditis bovis]